MKKNININICGIVYSIDEDACTLLEQYMDSIREYFAKQEGGDEIADDIEHRIGELLWEKKQQGVEAIDLMTVKTILKQIGKPEQMTEPDGNQSEQTHADAAGAAGGTSETGDAPASDQNADTNGPASEGGKRKLYRDVQNKMLGGVLSGLAQYFGGHDPLPWRLGFVVLVFLLGWRSFGVHLFPFLSWEHILMRPTLWPCLCYVIAWMVLPEAKTAEQRIEMRGGQVNAETIQEEVIAEQERQQSAQQQKNNEGCLGTMLGMLVVLFKIFVFAIGGIFLLSVLVFLIGMVVSVATVPFSVWSEMTESRSLALFVMMSVGCIVAIGLPVYCLGHRLFGKQRHSLGGRVMIVVLWLLSLLCLGYSAQHLWPVVSRFGETGWFDHYISGNSDFVYDGNKPSGVSTEKRSIYTEEVELSDGSTLRIEHEIRHTASGTVERCDTIRIQRSETSYESQDGHKNVDQQISTQYKTKTNFERKK